MENFLFSADRLLAQGKEIIKNKGERIKSMKRLMAILLTGCLILQPITGSGAVVWGADFSSGTEDAFVVPGDNGNTGAQTGQGSGSADGFTPDAGAWGDVVVPQDPPAEVVTPVEIPSEDVPGTENPSEEVPGAEDPSGEVPGEEVPPTENPSGEVPGEEIPPAEKIPGNNPAEETPVPEEPGEEDLFGDEEQEVPGEDLLSASTGTGTIEVKVISMLPFNYSESGSGSYNVTVSVGGQSRGLQVSGKTATAVATFEGLSSGQQEVTVSARKFATYTQPILVKPNTVHKIEVVSARLNTGEKAHPGWIRLGDITDDGKITQEDVTKMLEYVHSGTYAESANLTMGIDEKEEVDLSDLQYLVQSLGEEQISSIAESFVPPAESVDIPETTAISKGSVENVLKGEGSLELKTANDAPISADNPVEIAFALAAEDASAEDTPKIGGITIDTPTAVDAEGNLTSDISSGLIEIEYYDAGGTLRTAQVSIEDQQQAAQRQTALSEEQLAAPAPEESLFTDPSSEGEGTEGISGEEIPSGEELPENSAAQGDIAEGSVSGENPEDAGGDAPVIGGDQDNSGVDSAAGEDQGVPMDSVDLFSAPEAEGNENDQPSTEDMISAPALLFMASALFPQVRVYAAEIAPKVTVDADGSLVVDLGTQVAVKKVSIKITGTTKKDAKLVDIAKVEFVNDMEQKIPAPELSIPKFDQEAIKDSINNEEFSIFWAPENNVTGYDLSISGPVKKQTGNETQIVRVKDSPHLVTMINDKPIMNFAKYTVKIRSVNGDWTSPWSEAITVTPRPTSTPAAPDNVVPTGGYRSVKVSWKMMDDAEGYMLYYRAKTDEDAGTNPPADDSFIPVVEGFQRLTTDVAGEAEASGTKKDELVQRGMLTTNSFTIDGLADGTTYYVYVIGWNSLGWGTPSLVGQADTTSGDLPRLPEYQLINKSEGIGQVSEHILQALHGNHGGAQMHNSPNDEANKDTPTGVVNTYWAYGTVDNNYDSYWMKPNDWDDGISYLDNNFARGITISLDEEYKMSYLTFTDANLDGEPSLVRILYWNKAKGEERQEVKADLIRRTDDNGHPYFIARFHEPIIAQRIMMCLGTGYSRINMKVGEIHFHKYSEIDEKIYGLYADEMHSQLKEGVTEGTIAELEAELEKKDPESGELHPLYDYLVLELQNARDLLAMKDMETYKVETGITARKDGTLNYGGLNAWQPLGRTVYAGEKIIVFVGHNFKKVGENADLNLVFTQYHAESNSLSRTQSLKVGKNEFEVPRVASTAYENGGQIYVEYTGNNAEDQYGVRVSGGVKIPVLNLYKKTGQEKKDAISKYVQELEAYVGTIQPKHEEIHTQNSTVNYPYDDHLCVLNATDLMMEHMMYSVPATQVLAGLSDDSDKAAALETALDAMEQTMVLFYQHKGLTNMDGNTKYGNNNRLSARHLNIRYMRMFAGAFMYASGNHIGIEYPETIIASGAASWDSFGWGIAHEIGHDINDSRYAIAEITNNYFAQLLTKATKGTRFQYEDVYKKVTSGEIGRSSNGAVQLALYWQLHLAFDGNADDRHIYTTYDEMFNNLFFARVDTYSRNPGQAPHPLTFSSQNGAVDQNLMRLACAAAGKNILPFFERWGMVPDADTIAYANLYGEPTEKALYYVNEKARGGMNSSSAGISGQNAATASVKAENQYATLTIQATVPAEQILGYEIIRGTYTDGRLSKEVVGFTECTGETTTYVDKISTMNNRVMYYEVKAVDTALNYSNSVSAGSVKIETGGALNKENWTVDAYMITSPEDQTPIQPDADDPDRGFNLQQSNSVTQLYPHTIDRIIDGNPDTAYSGTASHGAFILIDMKTVKEVTSIKYKGSALSSVKVSVGLVDAEGNFVEWKEVKNGACAAEDTLWFDPVDPADKDKWIGTYDTQMINIEVPEGDITINEIEVCGPSGDNLEFRTAQETSVPSIGILKEDYQFAQGPDHVIPAGSLLFIGKYKGNPAYNVVVLYDENGNVVGAMDDEVRAEQVILAPDPGKGNLGETSDGSWIYYVEPDVLQNMTWFEKVRGELYRVDDALTLSGERVVSDTLFLDMPKKEALPEITLTGGSIPGATN